MVQLIKVTFTWPADCADEGGCLEPLAFQMNPVALNEVDPDGSSLLSAKLHFAHENGEDVDTKGIILSAEGPQDDECMSPAAISFVMEFIHSKSVCCPHNLEADGEA
jgi:hypothetical protein